MFITVGLVLLTALYIGLVAALTYLSPSECLDDSCFSEGVDNTILNWASDFFLAFWLFIFACQLSFCADRPNGDVRKMGILSQIFMGGAFVAAGIGNWFYPNSGIDDNHGMLGYWILRILFAIFFTLSGLAMSHFALKASEIRDKWVFLAGVVLFLSMSGSLTGNIWCSLESDLQVIEVMDDFEPTDDTHVCFQIMKYSEVAMSFAYALLWIPVALLFKLASQRHPAIVLGLPTPIAAIIPVVTQWTVGSIFVATMLLIGFNAPKVQFADVWLASYGTILYHWAMLMTLYCLHNLSYGLPILYDDDEDSFCGNKPDRSPTSSEDEPTPLSWEWWVTMVAGMVPEPKEKLERNKEFDEESSVVMKSSLADPSRNKGTLAKQVSFEVVEEEIEM